MGRFLDSYQNNLAAIKNGETRAVHYVDRPVPDHSWRRIDTYLLLGTVLSLVLAVCALVSTR